MSFLSLFFICDKHTPSLGIYTNTDGLITDGLSIGAGTGRHFYQHLPLIA
jgi:hypothetical protein